MKKLLLPVLLLTAVLFAETDESKHIDIGIGVFYRNSLYERKDNDEILPVPFIGARIKNFYYEAPVELGYHFYNTENLTLTAYGRYNLYTGYKPKDLKDEFKDMDKRRDDLHLGLRGNYNFGPLHTGIISYVSGDVSGKSDGMLARIEINQPIAAGERVIIIPYIGAEYMSEKYSDYYFGIKESEAEKGINKGESYKAGDTFNLEGGVRSIITINRNFKGLVSAEYTRYGKDVSNSPLVKDRNIYTLGMGISYSFTF